MKRQKETDPRFFQHKYRGEDLFFGGGKMPKGDAPEWTTRKPVCIKTILKRRKPKAKICHEQTPLQLA